MVERAPWLELADDGQGCLFSREQAVDNAEYLRGLFGASWISKIESRRNSPRQHAFAADWNNRGWGSYLTLNALASDLKQISSAPGFEIVVRDLKRSNLFEATLHVVRCAALISRSNQARIIKFFPQSHHTAPDFLIETEKGALPVEAKLFLSSDIEESFYKWADSALDLVERWCIESRNEPRWVQVIVKNALECPAEHEIITMLGIAMRESARGDILLSGKNAAIVVKPVVTLESLSPLPVKDAELVRQNVVEILAPRHVKEAFRVFDRCKKASRQLKSVGVGTRPGLLCLGSVSPGHVRYTAEMLRRKISDGYYSGIGAVLMVAWHTCYQPPRTILERVLSVVAEGRASQIVGQLRLQPLGVIESLLAAEPQHDEVAVYRKATAFTVEMPVSGRPAVIWMPDTRTIDKSLLA